MIAINRHEHPYHSNQYSMVHIMSGVVLNVAQVVPFFPKIDNNIALRKLLLAPEIWWLEDYFPFGKAPFAVDLLVFRVASFSPQTLGIPSPPVRMVNHGT